MGIADHPPAKRELRDELWTNISADLSQGSLIRVQSDFVLLPCRLAVAFVEGVAGYVETKRQTKCR